MIQRADHEGPCLHGRYTVRYHRGDYSGEIMEEYECLFDAQRRFHYLWVRIPEGELLELLS